MLGYFVNHAVDYAIIVVSSAVAVWLFLQGIASIVKANTVYHLLDDKEED